jgi:hypothetical protein
MDTIDKQPNTFLTVRITAPEGIARLKVEMAVEAVRTPQQRLATISANESPGALTG